MESFGERKERIPIPYVEIELPNTLWINREDAVHRVADVVSKTVPEGELKTAIFDRPQEYQFHCFRRRSDGKEMLDEVGFPIEGSTVEQAEANLHVLGTEVGDRADMIWNEKGVVRWNFFIPASTLTDISYIVVYKREPFVHPSMANKRYREVYSDRQTGKSYTHDELTHMNAPTLRDICIGYVKALWR